MQFLKHASPYLLILACLGDFSLPYLLGRYYPGFSQKTMLISDLGEKNSPVQHIFNQASLVTGSLFVLASLGVYYFLASDSIFLARIISISIALYGIGDCILSSLIQLNPESETFRNPAYLLHAGFTAIAMIAMLLVPFLLGLFYFQQQQLFLSFLYFFCLLISVVTLILFAAYYLPLVGKYLHTTHGLWQRISLLFLYLPAIFLALRQLTQKNL